jgi:quinol monooxygenase YgiN
MTASTIKSTARRTAPMRARPPSRPPQDQVRWGGRLYLDALRRCWPDAPTLLADDAHVLADASAALLLAIGEARAAFLLVTLRAGSGRPPCPGSVEGAQAASPRPRAAVSGARAGGVWGSAGAAAAGRRCASRIPTRRLPSLYVAPPGRRALEEDDVSYGLCGKIIATPGEGDALARYLLEAAETLEDVASCHLYVVSRDPHDHDAIWVMEAWDDAEAHKASLSMEAIQQLIARARPVIAEMGDRFELQPVGGKGLRPHPG